MTTLDYRPNFDRHRFSREEYAVMGDAHVFGNHRVELIEGEIIDMAPIGDAHSAINHPLAVLIENAFGPGFVARNQAPISLGNERTPSEPQPDIAVVVGVWRDYSARKPTPVDIRLIVEIADSSLTYDRTVKSALYAAAGIPEYWIVNLVEIKLEVYRAPVGTGYSEMTTFHVDQHVEALHAPGAKLPVREFFP